MDHVPFFTGDVTESAYKWEIPYSYSLSFLYNDRLQRNLLLKSIMTVCYCLCKWKLW